jgi:hypothetical protein
LRDRIEESIKLIREARDWMWDIGEMLILSRPLPSGLHEALEITADWALEALPRFKTLLDEAYDELVRAARGSKFPGDGGGRMEAVASEVE